MVDIKCFEKNTFEKILLKVYKANGLFLPQLIDEKCQVIQFWYDKVQGMRIEYEMTKLRSIYNALLFKLRSERADVEDDRKEANEKLANGIENLMLTTYVMCGLAIA